MSALLFSIADCELAIAEFAICVGQAIEFSTRRKWEGIQFGSTRVNLFSFLSYGWSGISACVFCHPQIVEDQAGIAC